MKCQVFSVLFALLVPVTGLQWCTFPPLSVKNRGSSVGMGWTIGVYRRWDFFSSPPHPDHFCGPPSLLSNGYREFLPRRQSGRSVKLTTHILVSRLRMFDAVTALPNKTSWLGAWWRTGKNFTFYLTPQCAHVIPHWNWSLSIYSKGGNL